MEEKNKFQETNWSLIEDLTKELYPDEFELASRSDLDFIEQRIVDGKDISFEDEGGDMHSYELYIITLQLVIATLHLVLDYLFSNPYKYGGKKKDEKVKDLVGILLSDDEMATKLRAEMKDLLISRRDDINQLLDVIEIKENQDNAVSQE